MQDVQLDIRLEKAVSKKSQSHEQVNKESLYNLYKFQYELEAFSLGPCASSLLLMYRCNC